MATATGTDPSAVLAGVAAGTATVTAKLRTDDAGTVLTASALVEVSANPVGDQPGSALLDGGFPTLRGDLGATGLAHGAVASAAPSLVATLALGAAATTPVVDRDGNLYAGVGTNVVSVDASGGPRWTAPASGTVATLALTKDGKLYAATDAGVVALRVLDGGALWTNAGVGAAKGAIPAANGDVYVAGAAFSALRPTDGALRWSYPVAGVGTPVVGPDGLVYVPTSTGVTCLDPATGGHRWSAAVSNFLGWIALSGGTVHTTGYVRVGSGVHTSAIYSATALDASSGAIRWSRTVLQGGWPTWEERAPWPSPRTGWCSFRPTVVSTP